MTEKPLRLAVVASHPIQYHAFRWRALAALPELDVHVLYCKRNGVDPTFSADFQRLVVWDIPLLNGYQHTFFRNFGNKSSGFWLVNPGIWRELWRGDYDAVYFLATHHFTHVVASMVARLRGTRVVYYSVCHDLDHRTRLKASLRNLVYRAVYKLANRILAIGTHARDHYLNAGAKQDKLVFAPHIVDNEMFAGQRDRVSVADARRSFGIAPDAKVLLFCAKMFAKKQPHLLLDAFIDADLDGWVLLMVGDGVLRPDLMADAARRAPGRVFFPGFLNQSEIGAAYRAADVHVLPSKEKETWGLVVNESLNFGCTQIVSDMVGCAPDLVAGKTGEVFPSGDIGALAGILRTLNTDPAKWQRYADAVPGVLETYSIGGFVDGVRAALGLAPAIAGKKTESTEKVAA